ncbi:iron-sulfur cluster carrier protein ApbC [Gammaproteobacteria bacterium]|nr:iron-sulfur cluster carrier protein ApbC [Gammaproteobacteria bacterium]
MNDRELRAAIAAIVDPWTGISLGEGAIRRLDCEGNSARVTIVLGYASASSHEKLTAEVRQRLQQQGVATVFVDIDTDIKIHSVQEGIKPLPGVKNILAVASGKGGVGKSTLSTNLALAMQAEGARVGILDADIYGPSQPRMLGITGKPQSSDGRSMSPLEGHGIQVMSIGFLIDDETPMIWRGPMVTQALDQLLRETRWDNLDYLIIDLPPGTGDTQLTLSQKVPVSAAIVVTTPQDIALLDARKAYNMFDKVSIPVLGIVENMSTHVCGQCGHEEHIFGHGGGHAMAEKYGVPFLGELPLDIRIRSGCDEGMPIVASDPDGELAMRYREIACRVGAGLAGRRHDYSHAFPSITIQQN